MDKKRENLIAVQKELAKQLKKQKETGKGDKKKLKSKKETGKKLDLNWKGRVIKQGAELFTVGTDTIKTTLFSRLRHVESGAGYLHFNIKADEEYFKQLTAEKQIIRFVKGFPVRDWVKKSSARNEALHTLVYAYAA